MQRQNVFRSRQFFERAIVTNGRNDFAVWRDGNGGHLPPLYFRKDCRESLMFHRSLILSVSGLNWVQGRGVSDLLRMSSLHPDDVQLRFIIRNDIAD